MAKSKFGFDVVLSNFKRNELKLVREIAVAQKNYFMRSFDKQAWGNKPWKEVKRRIKGTPEWKYPKRKGLSRRKRKILVGSGALRRDLNNSIKVTTSKGVRFQMKQPYAAIHNDGGIMGNGGKMPKRQFIGWNREVDRITKALIKKNTDQNFK
ncbi:phage virion morphogenesis protein [Chitinophaga sp. CC14]|uniref:phage virion morphogenesis protein n=1 Tax=Chitinophaga sp. CC14 TaxID=3029199 RepID=UPI003B80DBB6